MPGFDLGARDVSSGPNAYAAVTLLTEPCPQPPDSLFQRDACVFDPLGLIQGTLKGDS